MDNKTNAQTLVSLAKKKKVSLRGLSVVNDHVFWVSGTKGTVGLSTNAGKKVNWIQVKGYEQRDFRDVEAFDEKTAIIMAVDNPAILLKTIDGGLEWKKLYEKEAPGMFLNAMAFSGEHGICVGDPVNGRFWIIESFDAGDTWEEYPVLQRPEALAGEAIFAASGSNIQFVNKGRYEWGFITGGVVSRLILMGPDISVFPHVETLDMCGGKNSTGAFSWAVNGGNWWVAGGDYKNPGLDSGNHIFSNDNGHSWKLLPNAFKGYQSSICWITDNSLAACGPGGVYVSDNGMENWGLISKKAFHVLQKAKNGTAIYLAGPKGRVARFK